MGKVRVPPLTEEQRSALEEGYRHGKQHCFRKRCHMILLKSQGQTSKQIAAIVGGCEVVVNTWLDRFEAEGIAGLGTKPGQGKKPILDPQTDTARIEEAVKSNRQQLKLARLEAQTALKKEFSLKTLKRFLKKTAADTNASANVRGMRPMKKNTPTK
jgi:transposase